MKTDYIDTANIRSLALIEDIYNKIGAVCTYFSQTLQDQAERGEQQDPVLKYMKSVSYSLNMNFQQLMQDETLRAEITPETTKNH